MTDFGSTADDGPACLPDEEVLTVLASETRRVALRELRDDPTRTLEDLAATVADDGAVSYDSAERIGHRLHHCHLPKLDSAGLCRYDPDELRIEAVDDETVDQFLTSLGE